MPDIVATNIPAVFSKIEHIYLVILEKIFTLLKTYKTILFKDFLLESLSNDNLDHNLNKIKENIKPFLLNQQNNYLYNNVNYTKKLLHGIDNFLTELICNHGHLSLSMIDKNAFNVGIDLAITPGKIIYQNELMQLIQYLPTTDMVYETPILFIPSWINKYYLLDLQPDNSMVRWLVAQGFTVFMISWVNPDQHLATKNWENYLLEGPLTALNIITKKIATPVHMVGYCIGGTLLACALAYLQHNQDRRIMTATYFNTLLDFTQPGILQTFIMPEQLTLLNRTMNAKGYLDGRLLDLIFNMLRPNELIWSSFINYYLLEQKANALDFLFWNADPTNLPKEMFNFYIQNMYLRNLLKIPNGITLNAIPINLTTVTTPQFFVAAEKDHLVPWQSSYAGVQIHKTNPTFVLTKSGHVNGIINPPVKNKYAFKINTRIYSTPAQWLETATNIDGSWWPYWKKWLITRNSNQTQASNRLIEKIAIIEDAPGSYVHKRIVKIQQAIS